LSEAISWLEEDGDLAIFCEAMPWVSEPPPEDLRAIHRKKRSFAVSCGSSRARITAILVGVVSGACKNLGEDLRCTIYERRPLVCRIYPAEINPFVQFSVARKGCPPEAWTSDRPLLSQDKIVDPHLQSLIERSIQTDRDEALQKGLLCADLNIDVAAIADEGFVAHEPNRKIFLDALRKARSADPLALPDNRAWRLYSRDTATLESLSVMGMETISEKRPEDGFTFLHAPSVKP
jgi:hypothetical protein